jgi:hypothetical protein
MSTKMKPPEAVGKIIRNIGLANPGETDYVAPADLLGILTMLRS